MFGRKTREPAAAAADVQVLAAARAALPQADEDTLAIVGACAGLLAAVAYADREFSALERERVRRLLATISGIGPAGAEAVATVLEQHVVELATVHVTRFARTLKELGDRELRLHVLGMLIEVCLSDQQLGHEEQVMLRQTTSFLGLEQADFNHLQAERAAGG